MMEILDLEECDNCIHEICHQLLILLGFADYYNEHQR